MKIQKKIRLLFLLLPLLIGGINFTFSASSNQNKASGISFTMDFTDNILNSYLDNKENNAYMSAIYSSNFSTDPYGDVSKREDLLLEEQFSLAINFMEQFFKNKQCDITRGEFTEFLDAYSIDYQNDIILLTKGKHKNKSQKNDKKDRQRRANFCVKYNSCIGKSNYSYDCMQDIVSQYQNFKNEALQYQSVSVANMGKAKFFNNSLEDSPYDIKYDISVIEKIVFESVDPKEEILFYTMPAGFGEKKKKNTDKSDSLSQTEIVDPYASSKNQQTMIGNSSNGKSDSQVNNEPLNGGNSNNVSVNTSNTNSSNVPSVLMQGNGNNEYLGDEEFENFFKGENYATVDATFGGKRCIPYDLQTQQIIQHQQRDISQPLLEIESLESIISPENLSTLGGGENPSPSNQSTLPLTHTTQTSQNNNEQYSEEKGPGSVPNLSDPTAVEEALQEAKKCMEKCEDYASYTQRLNCKAQCVCGRFESSFFQPNEQSEALGLKIGPVLALNFCTVPATSSSTTRKGGKVMSIEEVFNEIKNVLEMLSNSGELGIYEQQHEMMDSNTKSEDFSKKLDITVQSTDAVGNSSQTNKTSAKVKNQNLEQSIADSNKYIVVQTETLQNTQYTDNTNATVSLTNNDAQQYTSTTIYDNQIDTEQVIENEIKQTQVEYKTFFNQEVISSLNALEDVSKVIREVVVELQMVSETILQTA